MPTIRVQNTDLNIEKPSFISGGTSTSPSNIISNNSNFRKEFVASGAISTGVPIVLNSNGTVSYDNNSLTTGNYIGYAQSAASNGETIEVYMEGSVVTTSSSLNIGQKVEINSVYMGIAIGTNSLIVKG